MGKKWEHFKTITRHKLYQGLKMPGSITWFRKGDGRVRKELWNHMERDVSVMPVPDYPDVVPKRPELSQEEWDDLIKESIENDKKYTEWPDV